MYKEVTVRKRQSIYDIAIIYNGSATAAPEIARINDINPDETIESGTRLLVSIAAVDASVVNRYKANALQPATGNIGNFLKEGIGNWSIELDFKVS